MIDFIFSFSIGLIVLIIVSMVADLDKRITKLEDKAAKGD